jgi:hypothetical protein
MPEQSMLLSSRLVFGKVARVAAGLAIRCLLVDAIIDVLRLVGL